MRFIPFMLVAAFGMYAQYALSYKPTYEMNILAHISLFITMGAIVAICLPRLRWHFNISAVIFMLGIIPDAVLTMISHEVTGTWSWEANYLVPTLGVGILLPQSLVAWLSVWLVREHKAGGWLMAGFACARLIAICSHFVLWADWACK